jgi:hypothetical protein
MKKIMGAYIIDCRSKNEKNVGESRGDIGDIRQALTSSFRKPDHRRIKKLIRSARDAFEDTLHLKLGFESVKFYYTRL